MARSSRQRPSKCGGARGSLREWCRCCSLSQGSAARLPWAIFPRSLREPCGPGRAVNRRIFRADSRPSNQCSTPNFAGDAKEVVMNRPRAIANIFGATGFHDRKLNCGFRRRNLPAPEARACRRYRLESGIHPKGLVGEYPVSRLLGT